MDSIYITAENIQQIQQIIDDNAQEDQIVTLRFAANQTLVAPPEPIVLKPGVRIDGQGATLIRESMPPEPNIASEDDASDWRSLFHEWYGRLFAFVRPSDDNLNLLIDALKDCDRTGLNEPLIADNDILTPRKDIAIAYCENIPQAVRDQANNGVFRALLLHWLRIAGQFRARRTFTTPDTVYSSFPPPIAIFNLNLDGNSQGYWLQENFAFEQAHLLFLRGGFNGKRLRVMIANCQFNNCTGDGVSIYYNVSSSIRNCSANGVFRGGVTMTGHDSFLSLRNFIGCGVSTFTGFEAEQDIPRDGTTRPGCAIIARDCVMDELDIGINERSVFKAHNLTVRHRLNVHAPNSSVRILKSKFFFHHGGARITRCKHLHFQDCEFHGSLVPESFSRFYTPAETTPAPPALIHILPVSDTDPAANQLYHFERCLFLGSRFHEGEGVAVRVQSDFQEQENWVRLTNCIIRGGFAVGFQATTGGNLEIKGGQILARTVFHLGGRLRGDGDSGLNYQLVAIIEDLDFRSSQGIEKWLTFGTSTGRHKIFYRNVMLREDQNVIHNPGGGANLENVTFSGSRDIFGTGSDIPDITPGFSGDLFHTNNQTWECIQTHYESAGWVTTD